MGDHIAGQQAHSLEIEFEDSTYSVERHEYFSRVAQDSFAFLQNKPDLLVISCEINDSGCVNDRVKRSFAKWRGPGIGVNERKSAANPRIFDHLGAEIDSITCKALLAQLGHDQSLAGADDQNPSMDVRDDSADAGQVEIVILDSRVIRGQSIPKFRAVGHAVNIMHRPEDKMESP